jgi:predicted negative regulator of RcsB-dependent stress response
MKKTGWLLIIAGAVIQVLMIFYGFIWYISLILLSTGYYLGLKGRGYAPFQSRHFYGMIVFSLFPIIGPIIAIISLTYLPNFGEQMDPARKKRAMLVSATFVIVMVIIMVLIGWQQFELIENNHLLRRAGSHIKRADVLKKEGKDFSGEAALAQKALQSIGRVFCGKYIEAKIALLSGDLFCLQGRYEEAEKMYKDAADEMPKDVKERLARLKELKKEP